MNGKASTPSLQYTEAMGLGINLGNTFDAFDRVDFTEIDGPGAWGNPMPTQEYMNALVNQGFKSIRIPFTAFTRTGPAPDYTINETFFSLYQQAVDMAVNAGLYVMVNLHHDSSEWLINWDGNTSSEQYTKFEVLWRQLANRFKEYGEMVMFESINEPFFNAAADDAQNNEMLGKINKAFHDVVRATGGNNATRMLVVPTTYTNDSEVYSEFLKDFILGLDDENMIATVHWYCSTDTYAFTTNIGVPFFDEKIKGVSARESTSAVFDRLKSIFTDNGIGVAIGEFGLFNQGYPNALNDGEVAKYMEYVIYRSKEIGVCPMLWDVGQIINRNTGEWGNDIWGGVINAAGTGRSSYATGLDHVFIDSASSVADIDVPLTLNGNTLTAIYNGALLLESGVDYTYAKDTVTLKAAYLQKLANGAFGTKADLQFVFSAGAVWHQFVNYTGDYSLDSIDTSLREDNGYLSVYDTDHTATYPTFIVPGNLGGRLIRRIKSLDEAGEPASGNTWASDYMQFGAEFKPVEKAIAYNSDIIAFLNWYTSAIQDGTYTIVIEFFDGDILNYKITKAGSSITGSQI